MRKVFLDDLPRWEGGTNKDRINWKASVGRIIKFVYDDIEDEIQIIDHNAKKELLIIRYNNNDYNLKIKSLRKCQLGIMLKKYTGEFKVEIGQEFQDEKRNMIITNKTYKLRKTKKCDIIDKYYEYHCNICGYDGSWVSESDLLNKNIGCSCCHGKTVVEGINDINTTTPEVVKYFYDKSETQLYTKYSKFKVKVKCISCGRIKQIAIASLCLTKSIGCSCGDGFSVGHKYIHELLSQLNINFTDNYKPKWCKYYNKYKNRDSYGEYDFFIENMKLIIEVDGSFHRKDNKLNGQTKEESEYIDNMKDILANKNGYKVIRILYEEGDLKGNILKSELAEVIDLSIIDWIKCDTFSFKNITKEICNYWNDKKEWETVSNLAEKFKLDKGTIVNYLKKGNKLSWCCYSGEDEIIKNNLRNKERVNKALKKKIEILKDGKSLGIFESITNLERESEKIFGVKLLGSKITTVAKGKRPHHKGYTFKYVE